MSALNCIKLRDRVIVRHGRRGVGRKDDAINFLRQVLADGPMSVADIETDARGAGVLGESQRISQSKPFRTAREALGIVPQKSSMAGGWVWTLPLKVPQ